MALIANVATPTTIPEPHHAVGAPIAGRFPTPPSAYGFCALVLDPADDSLPWFPVKLVQYYVAGVLQDEGSHMEKRKGQVWPR